MIEYLKIENFLIIEKLELDLNKGFNVIIGETGSGKSIILKAIAFVLGKRLDSNIVRADEEKAIITIKINIRDHQIVKDKLNSYEIEYEDNIILRRVITKENNSKIFLNDTLISNQIVKDIFENLLNIQTQNEKNQLFNNDYIITLIDKYHQNLNLVKEVKTLFREYKKQNAELHDLNESSKKIAIEKLYYQNIIDDLTEYNFQENEYDLLSDELQKAKEFTNIKSQLQNILNNINSDDGILGLLNKSINISENLHKDNPEISNLITNNFNQSFEQIDQTNNKIEEFILNTNESSINYEEIKEKISLYKSFARKYKVTENQLYDLLNEAQTKIIKLSNIEQEIINLEEEINKIRHKFNKKSLILSDLRKKTAKNIENSILKHLAELNMENAKIKIDFNKLEEKSWSKNGFDQIEFLIAANPGQPLTFLKNSVSGGEMSRIMLAIKLCFASKLGLNTLIFDEIDAGIGGETAKKIAIKLKELSHFIQVISITHNELIASNADLKLKISKKHINSKTYSFLLKSA